MYSRITGTRYGHCCGIINKGGLRGDAGRRSVACVCGAWDTRYVFEGDRERHRGASDTSRHSNQTSIQTLDHRKV